MPAKGSRKSHCKHGHSLEGYAGGCRTCRDIRYGEWIVENPEAWKTIIRKYTYKLNKVQFEELLKEQENKCAICDTGFENKRPFSPSVDHDHNLKKWENSEKCKQSTLSAFNQIELTPMV